MSPRRANLIAIVAAVAVVALMSPPAWPDDLDPAVRQPELALLQQINLVRMEYGLQPLAYAGDPVRAVARSHSQRMLDAGFFAHRDDLGRSAGDRLTTNGVEWRAVGENLLEEVGAPSVDTVLGDAVDAWTDSPEHRANILNRTYTATAIGIASRGDKTYLTQLFIAP